MSTRSKSILIKRDLTGSLSSLTTASSTTSVDVLTTPPSDLHFFPTSPFDSLSRETSLTSPSRATPGFKLGKHSSLPPLPTNANAQFINGETNCPDATELVYLPELRGSPWLPFRWVSRQGQVADLLAQIAAAEVSCSDLDDDHSPTPGRHHSSRPISIAKAPARPPISYVHTYASINGIPAPSIPERTTSIMLLVTPPPDEEQYSSDSDTEDYRQRKEQTIARVLEAEATLEAPLSIARSARHSDLSIPGEAEEEASASDSDSAADSSHASASRHPHDALPADARGKTVRTPPVRIHRKVPHYPPPNRLCLSSPYRPRKVRFGGMVRVHGGIRAHRQEPMLRTACAADHLKLNLRNAELYNRSEPGASRQFYLAPHQSNPSSANSSVVSFEYPINLHSYVPASCPRQISILPHRVPLPKPRPKPYKPKPDWMYQRLLEGIDSDDSDWMFEVDSSSDETEDEEVFPQRSARVRSPEETRVAAWKAHEDALVLHDLVNDWRTKVKVAEAKKRDEDERVSRIEATQRRRR